MHHNPLFALLDNLKQTGPNRYQARCPAHDDKNPSLSLSVTDDGRILCHCFAGCSAGEIMSAVGLGLSHLFPEGATDHMLKGATPWIRTERRKVEEKDEHNMLILAAAQTDRGRGKRLTPSQMKEERRAWEARRRTRIPSIEH